MAVHALTPGSLAPQDHVANPLDCLLRHEADYWTIVYDARVIRLRDSVGLRHLAQLLWHPHREFHALDLMHAVALAGVSRGGRRPHAGAHEIDAQASAEYRRRIHELEDDLAQAERANDLGRSRRAREELASLLRELRHGARPRRIAIAAERARVAVTKTIKATLDRLDGAHPALAAHLEATVKRGYVCVYQPDPRTTIRWGW